MRMDWSLLLNIFLAIVLARIFEQAMLQGHNTTTGTRVGAEVNSPAVPTITYSNPIDQYLAEKYPGAR